MIHNHSSRFLTGYGVFDTREIYFHYDLSGKYGDESHLNASLSVISLLCASIFVKEIPLPRSKIASLRDINDYTVVDECSQHQEYLTRSVV